MRQRGVQAPEGVGGGGGVARVRKASYYVWWLGAGECRGLRGGECVRPVLARLLARERAAAPDKVTLQVSAKGVRVLAAGGTGGSLGGSGAARHFIPAAAITYVQQEARPEDDLVSAVLLLYNPATRCPVHVHAYRCDSTETAALLREHLQQLAGRPDHQAKLAALEARLAARGLLPAPHHALPHHAPHPAPPRSDGASTGSSGSGSSSTPGERGGGGGGGSNVSSLYDSLAAELREKLGGGGGGAPLLLPPRDYDTTLSPAPPRPARKGPVSPTTATTPPPPPHDDDDHATTRSSGIGSDDHDHHTTPSPTQDMPDDDDDDWPGHEHPPEPSYPRPHHPRPHTPPRGRPRGNESPVRAPPPRHFSPIRMVAPLPRDLSPVRGQHHHHHHHQHQYPPHHQFQHQSHHQYSQHHPQHPHRRQRCPPRERSASPAASPRERFQDARDKFRSLERWGAPPTSPHHWEGQPAQPRHHPRTASPTREPREPREPRRYQRSPERDYTRARSMHDLSGRRGGAGHDPRRRSLYESDDQPRRYRSHASLGGRRASSPSSCSSSSSSAGSYAPLPETRRPPGLDKATARPDPLEAAQPRGGHHHHHHHQPRRTYDYPVNGGSAPLHMTRSGSGLLHDDLPRRAPRGNTTPQFIRSGVRY